jgi:excisionase family DNA binding protein
MSERLQTAVSELVAALHAEMSAQVSTAPHLLAVNDAALALGISRAHLYRLLSDGSLRSIHIGRRRLVPASAIEDLLREPMG